MSNSRSRTHRRPRLLASTLALGLLLAPALAQAATITFDDLGFEHGSIVSGVPGVSIVANNPNRGFSYAVAFDTERSGTRDEDLEAQWRGLPRWSGGNLSGVELGMILILQENDTGCGDGVCDLPDDEGSRPAGSLSFLFDVPVSSIGFDLIDIDSTVAEAGSVTYIGTNGGSVTQDLSSILAGLDIGNNTANRIAPPPFEPLGLEPIEEIVFNLGGSGGLDNLTFTPIQAIPEPSTALMVGLGLLGLGLSGQRRTARD